MNRIITLLTAAAIIIGFGWFFLIKDKSIEVRDLKDGFGDTAVRPQILAPERKKESEETLINYQAGRRVTYEHQRLGFSFEFPEGYKVGEFTEGLDQSETILIQKDNVGFQLKITPFEDNVILTPEKIKKDIPDIVIDEPLQIRVGEAIAVVFLSDSESLGQTREIWWVYQNNLYQITTYTEFDEVMVSILESWRF